MSGDGTNDVYIPSVFLFSKEGNELIWNMRSNQDMIVFMGDVSAKNGLSGPEYALTFNTDQLRIVVGLDRQKSCSKMHIFLAERRTQCFPNDYAELKPYFDLYNVAGQGTDDEDKDTAQLLGKCSLEV